MNIILITSFLIYLYIPLPCIDYLKLVNLPYIDCLMQEKMTFCFYIQMHHIVLLNQ
ncbi:hypothetical protein D3OALGA1CA_5500 [Olavius algarvensis associated proteobacterium Delta 3]|nr:hypothetical protein D3OALGB2SA_1344 [Olavius algarvensis associated proteobacterium Delta 3]CAB5167691.1 hypothetical protein D3OALGA1CA_5500 [Olavius algarvensis associated proteobacterium Delta 3]